MDELRKRSLVWNTIKIALVCVFVGFLVMVAIPFLMQTRLTRSTNACVNNLRQIEGAKQQWALENGKGAGTVPTEHDLRRYCGKGPDGDFPVCPDGGTYIIGRIGEEPRCSLAASTWPNNHALSYTNDWWTNFKSAYAALLRKKLR